YPLKKIISTNMLPPPPATYQSAKEHLQKCSSIHQFSRLRVEFIIAQEHNKDKQALNISGHPIVHQLTKQQLDNVTEMTASGSCSREIISTIHQNNPSAFAITLIDELKELIRRYSSVLLMDYEEEENYLWALTCVAQLFDSII
ncbi:7549_t:CDS:2, partial [Racocetra persica]